MANHPLRTDPDAGRALGAADIVKVYEALADGLVAEGVEVVFGLLGGGNAGLLWELQQRGVRFIPTRHEQGAVGMADGYSRATGQIGVASLSHGPGLTNAATPMVSARHSRSRVLVITSDVPPDQRHNNMKFDQAPFILSTAGAVQHLAKPSMLTETLELSLRHIRAGLGPVVLNTPDDVIDADLTGGGYVPTGLADVPAQPRPPHERELEPVRALIETSERPLILAGRGASDPDTRDALVALAKRSGALVTTTLLAKSLFAQDRFDLGICGGFALPEVATILQQADLVLAFGTSLSSETTGHGTMFPQAKLVHIDTNPTLAREHTVANRIIVGDARLTAERLTELLSHDVSRWRSAATAARIAAVDRWDGVDFGEAPGFVNPYSAYRLADALLPRRRLLVVDGGYFMGGPATHITVQDPGDLLLPWRFGAIGGAVGPAIGAAAGRRDRTTVLFIGDGGLMMNLQELDTAVRCRLPLLIFVMDNGGFAMERPAYANRGWATEMADYENPDFGVVASALGFAGYTPSGSRELEEILQGLGSIDRPTLINLRVARDAQYLEIDRWVAGYAHAAQHGGANEHAAYSVTSGAGSH